MRNSQWTICPNYIDPLYNDEVTIGVLARFCTESNRICHSLKRGQIWMVQGARTGEERPVRGYHSRTSSKQLQRGEIPVEVVKGS